MARKVLLVGVLALAGVLAGSLWGGTIVGTTRADTLRGTPKADRLDGKGGNDKLYGLAGNDVVIGGGGADLLSCGAGRDTAIADAKDTIRRDCEVVQGLPKSLPPPPAPPTPPPPPPVPRDGRYVGQTSQLEEFVFDVVNGGTAVTNLRFKHNESCQPSPLSGSSGLAFYVSTSAPIPVAADGTWALAGTGTFTVGRIVGTFVATVAGTLSVTGTATGTIRVDSVTTAPIVGQCTSGSQTWTATIP